MSRNKLQILALQQIVSLIYNAFLLSNTGFVFFPMIQMCFCSKEFVGTWNLGEQDIQTKPMNEKVQLFHFYLNILFDI